MDVTRERLSLRAGLDLATTLTPMSQSIREIDEFANIYKKLRGRCVCIQVIVLSLTSFDRISDIARVIDISQ